MGVKGLTKFITKFHGKEFVERIAIAEEIEEWKINHSGKAPIILIDLKECTHMLVQNDEIGIVLGGRYDYYTKMFRQFLENFSKTGAKLVFFLPGRKYSDDLQFFIPRTEGDYMKTLSILDAIEEKSDLKQFLDDKNRISKDIRMELSFNYNLPKIVRKYGEMIVTYVRHNQEIAQYANKMSDSVLAVISNDTDFLAFDGEFEFWRATNINYKQMSTFRYNKTKLFSRLGFDYGATQLQMLSALCGSNYLPNYAISEFLTRLKDENTDVEKRGTIWNVAEYVKRQPVQLVKDKPAYDLKQISRDVFGDEYTPEQLNAIANQLACYDLNALQDLIQAGNRSLAERNSFLKFCKTHNRFMYKMATDEIITIKDITFMDFRNFKSKTYAELIIPILMKICGVLLKETPRRPFSRQICMKHAHDEPSKLTEEKVIYPPMRLPECFDIIFKNKERSFDKIRGELLEWMLELDDGMIKKLLETKNSKSFGAVIVTLAYLIRQEELTTTEANAILYTEHKIRNLGTNQIEYPREPNAHYVRIAHLYVKMYVLISHCIDVCGLHEMTDLLRFDGPLFHKHLEKIENSNPDQLKVIKSVIDPIWIFN